MCKNIINKFFKKVINEILHKSSCCIFYNLILDFNPCTHVDIYFYIYISMFYIVFVTMYFLHLPVLNINLI